MNFSLVAALLLIGLSLVPTPVEAEREYRAGLSHRADADEARIHFRKAAEIYEQLWDQGPPTSALARNGAQARLLSGDLGLAIHHYLRGLRLTPHDRELRLGLAFARERVGYPLVGDLADRARPISDEPIWQRQGLSLIALKVIFVSLAAVGWALLAWAWQSRRRGVAVVGGMALVIAAGGGIWLHLETERLYACVEQPMGVVIEKCDFRSGNSAEYPKRVEPRLPEGVELRLLGERGGWLHVELADGMAGWVMNDRVAVVE